MILDSNKVNLFSKRKKYANKYTFKVCAIKYLPILGTLIFQNIWVSLIFGVLWWLFATVLFDHRGIALFRPAISVWFGVPGSGKTSMCAWLSKHSINQGYKVLSNVDVKGTYRLESNDLGHYDMSFDGDGAHVIIDEAMINGLYNRNYKDFAKSTMPLYFSLHRHMNNRVDVFSQGYDIDLNVKQRTGERGLFHLQRLPIKGFVMYRQISKIMFIRKDDKQFVDGFKYSGLPRICYTKGVWHSFDTLDMSQCPTEQKEWQLWDE